MKGVKIAAGSIIALVLLLWIVGYMLDSSYKVERSVVINTNSNTLMTKVADFKQWQQWGVWFLRDPEMKVAYTGEPQQIGHQVRWESVTQGNGSMTLTSVSDAGITYDLQFTDVNMASDGQLTWQADDNGLRVTWTDMGDVGDDIVSRYFILFIDSMLGPDFEEGLANLKRETEKP